METIKIAVDINVNFSEETKKFITCLFTSAPAPVSAPAPKAESKPASAPAPKAESKPAPAQEVSTPAPKAESRPAPAQEVPASKATIEDVRQAVSTKVSTHRAEIKEKLTELGAPSVTKLDPAKYDEMLDFLNNL